MRCNECNSEQRNGRLHGPEILEHLIVSKVALTPDTEETCCACYSADTAMPYSPLGLLRYDAAAVADETAAAAAALASSATTPLPLTYRGKKNIRIAQRWPSILSPTPHPPATPLYSWRVAIAISHAVELRITANRTDVYFKKKKKERRYETILFTADKIRHFYSFPSGFLSAFNDAQR